MTYAVFVGPQLKLDRARHHIEGLRHKLSEYKEAMPYELRIADGQWVLQQKVDFPNDIPLTIGDAVHNLRAALDLAACDAVRAKQKSHAGVKFPFAESAGKLEDYLRREIKRAGPKVCDLIRSLRPFKGGNLRLRGLHDLDIMDKHQLIIPCFGLAELKDLSMSIRGGPTVTFVGTTFDLGGSKGLRMVKGVPLDAVSVSGSPPDTKVVLGLDTPFPDKPVIELLEDLHMMVKCICEKLRLASESE